MKIDRRKCLSLALCSQSHKHRHVMKTKHKQMKIQKLTFLPQDIIFNILSWISADFLYTVVRFVSKYWGRIISSKYFVETHQSRSKDFLLLEKMYRLSLDLGYTSCFELNGEGIFRSWRQTIAGQIMNYDSTGLMILLNKHKHLYLVNPVTKQHLRLPDGPSISSIRCLQTAYIPRTGEIKILRGDSDCSGCWSILRVGNNMSWKILNHTSIQNIPFPPSISVESFCIGSLVIFCTPVAFYDDDRIWAVDLDDESFHVVDLPVLHQ